MEYKKVLIIAGSDSGGGAGIQADIKAASACGAYAATAITAITVQNTLGVSDIHPVPTHIIQAQIRAVLGDIGADAIKIGMLHSIEVMQGVLHELNHYPRIPIVLDPVMVSTSGHRLMLPEASQFLLKNLVPRATIITPNLPEAEELWGKPIRTINEMKEAARALSPNKTTHVYLKAGHLEADELTDIFYNAVQDTYLPLSTPRIDTQNTHGTGCTLSSALAAYVALGYPIEEVVQKAKAYITETIKAGSSYRIGQGHGPVHHFYKFWE